MGKGKSSVIPKMDIIEGLLDIKHCFEDISRNIKKYTKKEIKSELDNVAKNLHQNIKFLGRSKIV